LVVDSVKPRPSANPPGVVASLLPLPTPRFEVAAIRPCADNYSGNMRFEAGGRVTAVCMPMLTLIQYGWDLRSFEQIVDVPKWLADRSSTKYNISIVA